MPRHYESSYPRRRSSRPLSREEEDREDREPEPGDERISSAHRLRDDERNDAGGYGDDGDDDGYDGYDDGDYGDYDDEDRDRRLSKLPGRGGDEEIDLDIDDVDVMEVLDDDDLKQMDGPDA